LFTDKALIIIHGSFEKGKLKGDPLHSVGQTARPDVLLLHSLDGMAHLPEHCYYLDKEKNLATI
jgi:hypothetical protein